MAEKELKKEIVKTIGNLSGRYAPYQIFYDWVKITALGIYNSCFFLHNKNWEKREKQYMEIESRYSENEMKRSSDMFGMLIILMDEERRDWLGEIYMDSGCANKETGQFFTPYNLSRACAKIALSAKKISEDKIIELNEPSTGGGGMMIAAVDILLEMGINPQKVLRVIAQDLDWIGVYMTYIQLSILGIDAIVVQGDTLVEPYKRGYPEERIMRTPKNMGLLLW